MISDLINEILDWQRKQKVATESEPRSIRLEPRQIQSVSCVPGDEGGFIATLKKKLFGPPEVVVNKLGTFDLDVDPDPVNSAGLLVCNLKIFFVHILHFYPSWLICCYHIIYLIYQN